MFRERSVELQNDSMEVGELPCASGRSEGRIFRVGCALLPKKVSRYLTTSMYSVAHSRGVELILLDHNKPLLDQGEYDAIVHKLRPNKDWERNLQDYIAARPGVKVIDSLAGIRIVHNRATMLLPLRERPEGITLQRPLGAKGGCFSCARIQSPTQVEIVEGMSLAEAELLLQQAGLRPPLLVKPLWTDGREGSHGLAVLHDMAALGRVLQGGVSSALKPPLVVQQFVEHGGVLFKVYVLGNRTVVCQRPSLGDSYLSPEARQAGVLSLPRISCKSTYPKGSPEDRLSAGFLYNSLATSGGLGGGGAVASVPAGPIPVPSRPGEATAEGYAELGASGTSWWVSQAGGEDGPEAEAGEDSARESSFPPSPGHHYGQSQQQHRRQQRAAGPHERSHDRLQQVDRQLYEQQYEQQYGYGCKASPAVPPGWVTSALSGTLREKLGLQLFNFDMICPEEQPGLPWERLYHVVDINYFPGVDKIPDFEHIFVDFLTATCGGADANARRCSGGGGARGASSSETAREARRRSSAAESMATATEPEVEVEPDCDTDLLMASAGGGGCGEDGVSSVSSEKAERLLGVDAPAPAAEAEAPSEPYDVRVTEG